MACTRPVRGTAYGVWQIRFDTWQYHRVVSLIYDDEVEALNALHGTVEGQSFDSGRTTIKIRLGLPEGAQPCSTGHLDASGNPERDTNCEAAHPQNSPQKFLCQIMPPPEGTPQIICHPPLPPHPAQPPTRAPRVSAYTPPSPRQRQLPPPRPHSPPLISRRQPPLTPQPPFVVWLALWWDPIHDRVLHHYRIPLHHRILHWLAL